MRSRITFLALCATWLLVPTPVRAILIETTSPKLRVAGFLEKEDDNQIRIRVKSADGKEKVEVFDRAKIKILHKVDRARLEKLAKDQPKSYRDYADELAIQTNDPEAIELASRLYLISAYLDPANLGRSSLSNMSALATRPADGRKFLAMAFLLDAKAGAGMLKLETPKTTTLPASPSSKAAAKVLLEFLKSLKFYRSGDLKRAREYSNEKGVADYFAKAGLTDQKSFLQACNDAVCPKCRAGVITCATCNGKKVIADPNGMAPQLCAACNGKGTQKCTACDGFGLSPIPEDYLRSILRAELWAIEQIQPGGPTPKQRPIGGWSNAIANPAPSIPLMTLETISDFDPRKCVYRNGTWDIP